MFVRSDQYSFVQQGIPAVCIGDGIHSTDPTIDGLKVQKDWAVTKYHTPLDNMDQVLDYDSAARAAKVNFLVGYEIAQQDAAPAWNKGDFFGKSSDHGTPVKASTACLKTRRYGRKTPRSGSHTSGAARKPREESQLADSSNKFVTERPAFKIRSTPLGRAGLLCITAHSQSRLAFLSFCGSGHPASHACLHICWDIRPRCIIACNASEKAVGTLRYASQCPASIFLWVGSLLDGHALLLELSLVVDPRCQRFQPLQELGHSIYSESPLFSVQLRQTFAITV